MTLQIKDRIRETSTTTGTGTYTLGGAVAGFNPFADIADADTTYYLAERDSQWEIGLGTVGGTGTTLARTTILRSSNSDAAVNWGTGTKHIAAIVPAELLSVLAEVTGTLGETIRDTIGTALVGGDNITVTPDDGGDTITVAVTAMTASKAVATDGSGNLTVSTVTDTELGYLAGVTSGIQTQINALTVNTIVKRTVIARVDNTAAPPTEVSGDRYLLDTTGSSHAGWDGAAGNDVVEFNGSTWDAETPSEGWRLYNDATDTDWRFIDDGAPQWEEVAAAATSLNTLIDVVITTPTAGDYLRYNGAAWVNTVIAAADIDDPENFTFTASQVSDFSEAVDDRVAALFVAGSGVSLTYDDVANTLTIDAGAAVGQLADLTDVDDSLAGNKGDLLYHDVDDWTDLYIGTNGEVLTVVDGLPAWMPGAPPLLATRLSSSSYVTSPVLADGATSTYAMVTGEILYLPVYVTHDGTATSLAINVNATGTATLARLGIYAASAGLPGSLLLEAGTVDVTTTGAKTLAISQALTSGLYFLAVEVNGSVTLTSHTAAGCLWNYGRVAASPSGGFRTLLYETHTYGSFPSTASITDATAADPPYMAIYI
jgi:hypothetical protein